MDIPRFSKDLIDQLAKEWPPRCLKRGESVEDHIRYAAVCEFVQGLARAYEDTINP